MSSPDESFELIKSALQGQSTDLRSQKAQDIIALNAGASLYLSGQADSFKKGVALAKTTINSGKAWDKLQQFVQATQSYAN